MFFKELFYPKICLGCGFLGAYICPVCQNKLKRINKDSCLYCGRASLNGFTHPACKREKRIDGFISLFYYDNRLKKIIKEIKYRKTLEALNELVFLIDYSLVNKLKYFITKDLIIQAIPLHPQREKERGFNQVEPITRQLNQLTGVPIKNILLRIKPTAYQAQIEKKQQRLINIRGVFSLKKGEKINKNNFLIVDDVLTTGSTVKEAARVLKDNGADKIFVFTLAKG